MATRQGGITREEWLKFAWDPRPPKLEADSLRVLEQYSKIPPDDVMQHVSHIRDKAWVIHPYPCIGWWRFLHLALGRHPKYDEVRTRMLTGNEIFLDLGCAFAQDVRRLVADGVDSSKCYGSDLRLEFLDLGYELFRDKDTLKAHFIEADIFEESGKLSELYGKINIINSSSFFHLFSWDQQKHVARQCLKLWTGQKGDLLIGRQVGNVEASEYTRASDQGLRYIHNVDSWKRMWKEIGDEAGVEFEVEAEMKDGFANAPDGTAIGLERATDRKIIIFSVKRAR